MHREKIRLALVQAVLKANSKDAERMVSMDTIVSRAKVLEKYVTKKDD